MSYSNNDAIFPGAVFAAAKGSKRKFAFEGSWPPKTPRGCASRLAADDNAEQASHLVHHRDWLPDRFGLGRGKSRGRLAIAHLCLWDTVVPSPDDLIQISLEMLPSQAMLHADQGTLDDGQTAEFMASTVLISAPVFLSAYWRLLCCTLRWFAKEVPIFL